MKLIKDGGQTEKSVIAISFLNEGMKPETTVKYLRNLVEFGVIIEKPDGFLELSMIINAKQLEDDDKEKESIDKIKKHESGKKKGKKSSETVELENHKANDDVQNISDMELYVYYVSNCIKSTQIPISYDEWITAKYKVDKNIKEEGENKGKDKIPLRIKGVD